MKLGTADTVIEPDPPKRAPSRVRTTGPGPGNGHAGDGPNDDNNWPPFPTAAFEGPARSVDKSKYIALFLMMAVGMTFAGLLGAYLMVATNRAAEWQPFDLPFQIWISSALIFAGSVTYIFGRSSVDKDLYLPARKWFGVTAVLGALFVSSQLVLWLELVSRGFYLSGNPYAGFFYILTAVHVVHVAAGILALASILLRCWYPAANDPERVRRRELARSIGWYWHFMAALWIALFLMLGFWK